MSGNGRPEVIRFCNIFVPNRSRIPRETTTVKRKQSSLGMIGPQVLSVKRTQGQGLILPHVLPNNEL
jgi:hypothetical protein